jgi:hypothetical protein
MGVLRPISPQELLELLELLSRPGSPVGHSPGKAVVTLDVDPKAVVGDPVSRVTALVEGLQVTQDLGEGDPVNLATAPNDRDTAPVQQLIDQNAHTLIATDPTTRFPALEVGRHGFTRPTYRAHPKVVVAQQLRAKCSAHAEDRQAGRDTAILRSDQDSQPSR